MEHSQLSSTNSKIMPTVLAVIATIYGVSPIDLSPDIIPIVGWIDDIVILGGAYLNLAQAFTKDVNKNFAALLGIAKWIVWILGGIFILLSALVGISVYEVIKGL